MVTLTDFHLWQLQHDEDSIFHGSGKNDKKKKRREKEKSSISLRGVPPAKPITGPALLKDVNWLAKYQAMVQKMLLSYLNFPLGNGG